MAWTPTTRQLFILEHLRENPGATAKEIADASPVDWAKSADWDESLPGGALEGPGYWELPSIDDATAYAGLKRLRKEGLVIRERESHFTAYRHYAICQTVDDTDDELERTYRAPAAAEH